MNTITCAPWPNFSEVEGLLVKDVLMSNKVNYWTGQQGKLFESEFTAFSDCDHSIALANGTLAIDLALIALKIGAGDEVVVTPRSFMASASAIINAGAIPVFADVDMNSQNITAESIAAVLTKQTRAIICVHLAGWPCDMKPIMDLATQHNLAVIEDCAQAHGARYDGVSVGGFGEIGAWSFCQDKIMTTGGEGGMVTTNDAALYEVMWAYKDHGKNRQKMEAPAINRSFKFVHDSFGSNFRLTEMQAAIGRHQLTLMGSWTEQRTANALYYHEGLKSLDMVRAPLPATNIQHAFYKFYFFLNLDQLSAGWDRDRIVEEVNDKGGSCFSGSCPELYREGAFSTRYGEHPRLPVASTLGRESLMLTCHPGISESYLAFNLSVITDVLNGAVK